MRFDIPEHESSRSETDAQGLAVCPLPFIAYKTEGYRTLRAEALLSGGNMTTEVRINVQKLRVET